MKFGRPNNHHKNNLNSDFTYSNSHSNSIEDGRPVPLRNLGKISNDDDDGRLANDETQLVIRKLYDGTGIPRNTVTIGRGDGVDSGDGEHGHGDIDGDGEMWSKSKKIMIRHAYMVSTTERAR